MLILETYTMCNTLYIGYIRQLRSCQRTVLMKEKNYFFRIMSKKKVARPLVGWLVFIIYAANDNPWHKSVQRAAVTVGGAAAPPRALQKPSVFWSFYGVDGLSYKQHRCWGMTIHIWLSALPRIDGDFLRDEL